MSVLPLPAPGCIAYLGFIEGTGSTVLDRSGHGNDGSITGGTWFTDNGDRYATGYGVALDGSTDVLKIPDDASLDVSDLSVRIRFRYGGWENGNTETFITKTESGNVTWRLQSLSSGEVRWSADSRKAQLAPVSTDSQEIHELVMTVGSSQFRGYHNGVLLSEASGDTVGTSADPVRIGASFDESTFTNMDVFSVELYDRVLPVSEVQGRYQATMQRLDAIQKQTRWFDDSWTEQAAVDPNAGTRKLPLLSSPPSNPEAGDYYLDDGTNTGSGNVSVRVYDGTAWVDQN